MTTEDNKEKEQSKITEELSLDNYRELLNYWRSLDYKEYKDLVVKKILKKDKEGSCGGFTNSNFSQ